MDEDFLTSLFPKADIPPPEPGARLFAMRGCGDGPRGHGHTAPGVHLGYQAEGWGPASLCGSGNESIGWYRHHIWTEVSETEVNCRTCYEKGKELSNG
jgi:hypothetical protein